MSAVLPHGELRARAGSANATLCGPFERIDLPFILGEQVEATLA